MTYLFFISYEMVDSDNRVLGTGWTATEIESENSDGLLLGMQELIESRISVARKKNPLISGFHIVSHSLTKID